MGFLLIRTDLVARLRKLGQVKGLSIDALANLYLEACVNHEEQMMARDTTVVREIEAVLVRAMVRGEYDGRGWGAPENGARASPETLGRNGNASP